MTLEASGWADVEQVREYLAVQDQVPRRSEGDATLLEFLPPVVHRFLDLGTGGGRMLTLVLSARPHARAVGLDMSVPMLDAARRRFDGDERVELLEGNLDLPLPALGSFDAIVSSFAIHHCHHERKRALFAECFDLLTPGGAFLNLDYVSSSTERLSTAFVAAVRGDRRSADTTNAPIHIPLAVSTQVRWLEELGFEDVDCHWKWRGFALFGGVRPRD